MWVRLLKQRLAHLAAFGVACAIGIGTPSQGIASQSLLGSNVRIYYNSGGLWADYGTSNGIQIYDGGYWNDVTWPGTPWQQITMEYSYGGVAYNYSGNASYWTYPVTTESNLSVGTTLESFYVWTPIGLTIERTETWDASAKEVYVWFTVTNPTATTVTNFRLIHGIDPDQDYDRYSNFSTRNDVRGTPDSGRPVYSPT